MPDTSCIYEVSLYERLQISDRLDQRHSFKRMD